MLCDFLDIDQTPAPGEKVDKDGLIDRLLDFLGAPEYKLTKSYTKQGNKQNSVTKGGNKSPANGKKRGRKAKTNDIKMPTDDELREWVRAFVVCFNVKEATLKNAVKFCSEKFEIDLKPCSSKLKIFLAEQLS